MIMRRLPKFSICQSERDVMRLAGVGTTAHLIGKTRQQIMDVLGSRGPIETYMKAMRETTKRIEKVLRHPPTSDFVTNMEWACGVPAKLFTFPRFVLPPSGRLSDLAPEEYLPRIKATAGRPIPSTPLKRGSASSPRQEKPKRPDVWTGKVRLVMDKSGKAYRLVGMMGGNKKRILLSDEMAAFFLLLKGTPVVESGTRVIVGTGMDKKEGPRVESFVRKLRRWGWNSLIVNVWGKGYAASSSLIMPDHDALTRPHWSLREGDGAHKGQAAG